MQALLVLTLLSSHPRMSSLLYFIKSQILKQQGAPEHLLTPHTQAPQQPRPIVPITFSNGDVGCRSERRDFFLLPAVLPDAKKRESVYRT